MTLLPNLGEDALFQQFRLDEPWDSAANLPLVQKMPKVYAHPRDRSANQAGKTHYQVCVGPGTVFESPEGHSMAEITDARFDTAMVLEASNAVTWTKPDDLPFDPNGPLPILGGQFPSGFYVLMCDSTVRFLGNTLDNQTRQFMIQRQRWNANLAAVTG